MESRRTTPEPDDLYGRDAPGAGAGFPPPRDPDPAALFILLDALRLAAPADLQDRLTALIREALLTLRALIDRYLERLDQTPTERTVEDIPID
jgi:hypothetical protein